MAPRSGISGLWLRKESKYERRSPETRVFLAESVKPKG